MIIEKGVLKKVEDSEIVNRTVVIPKKVTEIGEGAFFECNNLKKIEIPEKVTKIGKNAFASCRSLTEIKVSEENPNYKSIDGVLYNKDGTELLFCPPLKEKLLISNDVMYVEWNNIYI